MLTTGLIINLSFSLLLSIVFYAYHHKKYDTMLIFFLGNFIGLIVTYFIGIQIEVGTGIGLFAIFSLMHFRENYNTYTMLYIFLSISMGILGSLLTKSSSLTPEFLVSVGIITLIVLMIFESFLGTVKKTKIILPVGKVSKVEDMVRKEIGDVKIKKIAIPHVDNGLATVVVSYKKRKKK